MNSTIKKFRNNLDQNSVSEIRISSTHKIELLDVAEIPTSKEFWIEFESGRVIPDLSMIKLPFCQSCTIPLFAALNFR